MAPPAKSAPRPGRALAVLAGLIVILLLSILGPKLASPGQWHDRFKVGLGLDLSSGSEISMVAKTPSGGVPSAQEMNEAVSIISSRVNGSGTSGATVQTQGNDIVTVSIPGKTGSQVVQLVSTTALLRFRQVLLEASGSATSSASASPSPSASTSPSASASATSSPKPTASATSTAKTSAKIEPAASATASPSAPASASASAHATASPSASASASASPSASSSASTSVAGNASLVNKQTLALFNKLNCTVNTKDPNAWKKTVGYTKPSDWDSLTSQTVSCDATTGTKYAMDVAKVRGEDVTGASAQLSTTNNQWMVLLNFNGAGSKAFGDLTTHLYNTYFATSTTDPNAQVLDQVAIVLDGNVSSAPEINQPITAGQAQITGGGTNGFTQQQATDLANILKYGSLPLSLSVQSVQQVSATLGSNQLAAGLLAAAVGLALVVLYSAFYYRGLSLVSISSLGIAALIGYLAIVMLSLYQGFTLNLAGIAGLIVAIGITADSFVVFFERIRDEVREGKQLRPAVEAGWKRARRTIMVSDTVSFLAALLLYYFAISDVKGFAYTLGLTTIIDIVVVFMFTKPLMTLVARSRFFGGGGRWSGLDPARLGARTPWRGSTVRRTQPRAGAARTARRTSGEA